VRARGQLPRDILGMDDAHAQAVEILKCSLPSFWLLPGRKQRATAAAALWPCVGDAALRTGDACTTAVSPHKDKLVSTVSPICG
jgi:hypothetical protein